MSKAATAILRKILMPPLGVATRRSRCGATTLVELLVVTVIMTFVAVALAKAVSALLTIQQNAREESAVWEQLATEAARIERGLSLAKGVVVSGPANSPISSAVFLMEAGGVSFETNRLTGVSEFGIGVATQSAAGFFAAQTGDMYEFTVASDPRHSGTNERSRPMLIEACTSAVSIVSIKVQGSGLVRRLILKAEFPYRIGTNSLVGTNTLERPVRLWNAF